MRSLLRTFSVPQPAKGADFTFIPAGQERVRLLSLSAILTTSAVVANRVPSLTFKTRDALTYWSADTVTPQPASLAVRYSWAIGTGLSINAAPFTSERVGAPLPHLWLDADDTVSGATLAIDINDQWSSIAYRCLIGEHYEALEIAAELAQALTSVHG